MVRKSQTLPTFFVLFDAHDSGGDVTGIPKAAQEGNQEAAVRKLTRARTAHLPHVQRRSLGGGDDRSALSPIPCPGVTWREG
jgi:hypothetical protein